MIQRLSIPRRLLAWCTIFAYAVMAMAAAAHLVRHDAGHDVVPGAEHTSHDGDAGGEHAPGAAGHTDSCFLCAYNPLFFLLVGAVVLTAAAFRMLLPHARPVTSRPMMRGRLIPSLRAPPVPA